MKIKRMMMCLILAMALCVPIAKPGFVAQTTVSSAK